MFVEALRLIFVLAAVLGANRLVVARPSLFGTDPSGSKILLAMIIGAGVAYIVGGMVARGAERLLHGTEERVARRHASEIIASTIGLLIGALITSFISWPVLVFVEPFYLAAAVAAFLAVIVMSFTMRLAVRKRMELFGVLGVAPSPLGGSNGGCVLDSSAAIDGRVLALYRAGLLPLPLFVPAFIIWEMQGIADSGDPGRRRRGQRGLDMLASLREAGAEVRVLDEDPAGMTEPDAKLVVIARRHGLPIVTTDANLAKAAELQGVGVLNIQRLADMVRMPILPGERMDIAIVKTGREVGQGVGYLDDGTMVVVEGAATRVGATVTAEVTSVLQQDTGRLVFGKLADPSGPTSHLREVR